MRHVLCCYVLIAMSFAGASRGAGQNVEAPPGVTPEAPPPRALPSVGRALLLDSELETPSSNIEELNGNFQKLQEARQALQRESMLAKTAKETVHAQAPDNSRLKLRLGELLVKLNTQKARPVPSESSKPPAPVKQEKLVETPKEKIPTKQEKAGAPPEGPPPLNPAALAQALFKAENFEATLKAFRLIDLKGMRAEERCPIQYLTAVCLKRMGKMEEAANLFREIANARGDENMAACAQWQLSVLRWRQELVSQLDDVRQRRKMLENQP